MNSSQSRTPLTSNHSTIYDIVESNHAYYDHIWKKNNAPDKYAGWNWTAFFLPAFWLSYRHMYEWAALYFLFLLIELFLLGFFSVQSAWPYIFLIAGHLFFGLKGNALYTKKVINLFHSKESNQKDSKPAAPLFTKTGRSWVSALLTPLIMIFLLILPFQMVSSGSFGSGLDNGVYVYSDDAPTPQSEQELRIPSVFEKYGSRINLLYYGEEPIGDNLFLVSLFFREQEETADWTLLREREYSYFSSDRVTLDLIDAEEPSAQVGEYRVEIRIGEELVGSEEFTIIMP